MCSSCTKSRLRTSGLSSSVEFWNLKAVEPPKGGWTEETFRSENGVRLLQSLLRVKRSAVVRGMRTLSPVLNKVIKQQIANVVDRVEAMQRSGNAKSLILISPTEHEAMWAKAIEDEFKAADMKVQLEYAPVAQSVGVEVHRKTSLLMGAPWSDATNQAVRRRALELGKNVTSINDETRRRLSSVVQREIGAGSTVADTIRSVKESIPSLSSNRIPTIVRTEMGRAADEGAKQVFKDSEVVTHVSVIGCEAVEKHIPTYNGIPTCNIQDVPIADVDKLEFHPNHTGTIIPSRFVHSDGTSDRMSPARGPGPEQGTEGVSYDSPVEVVRDGAPKLDDYRMVSPVVPQPPKDVLEGLQERLHRELSEKGKTELDRFFDKIKSPETAVWTRIRPSDLTRIVADGRFKSQFETGSSGGWYAPDVRAEREMNLFGAPKDLPDTKRPIYGYLQGAAKDIKDHGGDLEGYGRVAVRMKPIVRTRTTWVYGDSLRYGEVENGLPRAAGTPVNAPAVASIPEINASWINRKGAVGESLDFHSSSYTEAQIWGGVRLEDIEEVVFMDQPSASLINLLKAKNISYSISE